MLRPGIEVVVEELLDLALLLARGGLVDRELDPAVAVGHDLGHQGRVLGVDDLVVVVDELGEAQHVPVVVDETVHVAELDVADAVIDLEQRESPGRPCRFLDLPEPGREDAVVVVPVDERVDHLAVGVDRAPAKDPVLVVARFRVLEIGARPAGRRLAPRGADIVDGEGDVVDAVAVSMDVLGDLAVRRQGAGQHDRDVVLAHDVARPVPDAGLEARVGDRGEAPERPEVVRGLAGVADPELDVVDALEGQEVLRLGVGILVDVGASLVGGPTGQRLGHWTHSSDAGGGRISDRPW